MLVALEACRAPVVLLARTYYGKHHAIHVLGFYLRMPLSQIWLCVTLEMLRLDLLLLQCPRWCLRQLNHQGLRPIDTLVYHLAQATVALLLKRNMYNMSMVISGNIRHESSATDCIIYLRQKGVMA